MTHQSATLEPLNVLVIHVGLFFSSTAAKDHVIPAKQNCFRLVNCHEFVARNCCRLFVANKDVQSLAKRVAF